MATLIEYFINFPMCFSVTYAEAQALAAAGAIDPATGFKCGRQYSITDATQFQNGTVVMQAISATELRPTGAAILYFPKYNRAVAGYDIWNSAGTYTAGDIVYWGHQAWENLTGAAGTAVDRFELDATNWVLFPSTDADWADHYDRVLYPVTYDFAENRIVEMDSMKGSKVTVGNFSVTDNLTDPIMNFPWNNDYSDNDSVGISGHINGGIAALLSARGSILMIRVGTGSYINTFVQQDGAFINAFVLGENGSVSFSQGTNGNIGSFTQGNTSSINFTQGNSSTLNSFVQGSVSSMTTFTQGNSSTLDSFVQCDYCVGNSFTQPASNTIQSVEISASSFRDFITDVNIHKVVIQGVDNTGGTTDIDFTGGTVCQTTPMTITQNSTPAVIAIYYNGGTQVIGSPND